MKKHTFNNFKQEWFFPKLIKRTRFNDWNAAGRPSMADLAQTKLLDIMENHHPEQLDEKVQAKIGTIIENLR